MRKALASAKSALSALVVASVRRLALTRADTNPWLAAPLAALEPLAAVALAEATACAADELKVGPLITHIPLPLFPRRRDKL
jgi:hypothetical protein